MCLHAVVIRTAQFILRQECNMLLQERGDEWDVCLCKIATS